MITNKRLYGKTGILISISIDTKLSNVTSILIKKNLFGYIINFGTITITSYNREIKLYDIYNRESIRKTFYKQLSL